MAGTIPRRRKALPVDVKRIVLHEAGYKCANPVCRTILTLDIHHMIPVAENGGDTPDNLLALCPNCHSLHHLGYIPQESVRAWKMLLLSINEAYDRKAIDILLTLAKIGRLEVNGEGILDCAALIASGLVDTRSWQPENVMFYGVSLSEKGKSLVEAWKQGDQAAAVGSDAVELPADVTQLVTPC